MLLFFPLWSDALRIRHHGSICSLAFWFQVAFCVAAVLTPFFVSLESTGLWTKESIYREQPIIMFRKQVVVEAMNKDGGLIAWSSIPEYNHVQRLPRACYIRSTEIDSNRDGRIDEIDMIVSIPLQTDEQIQGLKLGMFFQLSLIGHVNLQMESMLFLERDTYKPVKGLRLKGQLALQQTQALPARGRRIAYNTLILDPRNITSVEDAQLYPYREIASSRNETIGLLHDASEWIVGQDDQFQINATFTIIPQTIQYIPGPAEVLVLAWSIFLPLAILFWWFFAAIRNFIFRHQLIPTVIRRDNVPRHREHQF